MYKKELKENFCPLCLAAPLAFTGIGTSIVGGSVSDQKKKKRIQQVALALLSISMLLLYYYYAKSCKTCLT